MVADGGGPPVSLSSDDLTRLSQEAYQAILSARQGWCHFIIDGHRCLLSNPAQTFQLQMPDGSLMELRDPSAPVFDQNGHFSCLQPVDPLLA